MKENKILYILLNINSMDIVTSSYEMDKIKYCLGECCLAGICIDELQLLELNLDEVE